MDELKAFTLPSFKCQNVDPYYIFEHMEEFNIKEVAIDRTSKISDYIVKFNDEEHPVTYTRSFLCKNTLSISSTYYEKHKDLIDKLIIEICKKTISSEFALQSTSIIDEKKLNAIRDNSNIKCITLGGPKDVFTLDSDTYNKFKDTEIEYIVTDAVSQELEYNFDPKIYFNQTRRLIGDSNYVDLSTMNRFNIRNPLSEEELENLKYLNSKATVIIHFNQDSNFIEIINRLQALDPERKIVINVKDKNNFNINLFQHLNDLKNLSNISVSVPNEVNPIDLITYIKYEKELIKMITPAVKLSPFEKYLYAYNIAKQFKEYKENNENTRASRDLYQLLDNEYIVCVGFSTLLGDLLDKLQIENNRYSVRVETGYDGLKRDITVLPNEVSNKKTGEKKEILPNPDGHARREIHLVDPKYNIDGYFVADPTWDNVLEHDSYIYALMTHDEFVGSNRYTYMNIKNVNELFFVHNIEEFYQKLNILLDKNPDKDLNHFINELLERIEKLDANFFKLLADKYQLEPDKKVKFEFEVQQEILSDIGTHIIKKTNNLVNGEQFRQGITTIYNLIYDQSVDIESLVEETINYNKTEYEKEFPKRYRIDKDGNRTIEMNEYNKFDLDESPENKISL